MALVQETVLWIVKPIVGEGDGFESRSTHGDMDLVGFDPPTIRQIEYLCVAQYGSALPSDGRGRRFKSFYTDQTPVCSAAW